MLLDNGLRIAELLRRPPVTPRRPEVMRDRRVPQHIRHPRLQLWLFLRLRPLADAGAQLFKVGIIRRAVNLASLVIPV